MEHPDPPIPFRQPVTQRPRAVGGSIVHQQDFQVPVGLGAHRAHTALQTVHDIINRDDDSDKRILIPHTDLLPGQMTGAMEKGPSAGGSTLPFCQFS